LFETSVAPSAKAWAAMSESMEPIARAIEASSD
jgi:hypothetical protein